MPDSTPSRSDKLLPVLLAVAIAAAGGFAFLYFTRPNAGELGQIRVVVTNDEGKGSNVIHVAIAEAPLAQKETVAPGTVYTGTVNYPVPYLSKPNLKLITGKRKYQVVAETQLGFSWLAEPLPDDFLVDPKADHSKVLELVLGKSLEAAAVFAKLKPGLIFEDFTWEAKGLRASPSALPPQTYEQKGRFNVVANQEGVEKFPVPYSRAPNVTLKTDGVFHHTIITECTPEGFKWKNHGPNDNFNNGTIQWTAKGIQ